MAGRRKSKAHVDAAKRGLKTRKANEKKAAALFAKRSAAAKKGAQTRKDNARREAYTEKQKKIGRAQQKRARTLRAKKIRESGARDLRAAGLDGAYVQFFEFMLRNEQKIPVEIALDFTKRLADANRYPLKSLARKQKFYNMIGELYDEYDCDWYDFADDEYFGG